MHTFGEGNSGSGVPAFLAKLWRLVDDEGTNDLISWSSDGRSFIIQNQARFAKELLPLNYKHNNMASFIRQLNMYGFHKITSIDNGGLRFDRDEMEFSHPCFQKGHPYLLEHIKRKITNPKGQQEDKNVVRVEAVNRVLTEVKTMRGRQDALDSRFSSMKQENEALWREVAILRQKHMKQQQIVNKLIQFLITMVQPSRSGLNSVGAGPKRRFQLMINDAPRSSKVWLEDIMNNLPQRPSSPIIHELEEELIDDIGADGEDVRITDIPPDDDSCSLTSGSGRKSVDYLVDHIDDFEPIEQFSVKNMNDDTLSTPLLAKTEKKAAAAAQMANVQRKRSISDENGRLRAKQSRLAPSSRLIASNQESLLKNPERYIDQLANIKKEQEFGLTDVVPDIVAAQDTSSPVSAGSGNSFYSKDDLFTEEVPAELFDDGNCSTLNAETSPLLNGIGVNVADFANNIVNTQNASSISTQLPKAGTSSANNNVIRLADGTTFEVAKFNGKSNINDVTTMNNASELGSHLNDVQDDLDALKDILREDSYQFDPNALLNNGEDQSQYRYLLTHPLNPATIEKLFNNDDILSYGMQQAQSSTQAANNNTNGSTSTLSEYQPAVDLSELLDIATPNVGYDTNVGNIINTEN